MTNWQPLLAGARALQLAQQLHLPVGHTQRTQLPFCPIAHALAKCHTSPQEHTLCAAELTPTMQQHTLCAASITRPSRHLTLLQAAHATAPNVLVNRHTDSSTNPHPLHRYTPAVYTPHSLDYKRTLPGYCIDPGSSPASHINTPNYTNGHFHLNGILHLQQHRSEQGCTGTSN
jgi:hypothetical protein